MIKKTFYPFLFILVICVLFNILISKYYNNNFKHSLFDKKTEKPLISVVITSYNYEKYISKTIESVLNQSYDNFEIIIIDDGSKDSSLNIIKEYVSKYKNIYLYTHEGHINKGFVESMKLAINKAKGDYVAFCESDDFWDKDNLNEKIKIIDRNKNAVIVSNNIFVFGDKVGVIERQNYINFVNNFLLKERNFINLKNNSSICFIPTLSAVLIKKEILDKLDFNTPVPAFLDFWLYRQILSRYPLYYTKQKLTFWRQHNSYNGIVNSRKNVEKMDIFIQKSNELLKTIKYL